MARISEGERAGRGGGRGVSVAACRGDDLSGPAVCGAFGETGEDEPGVGGGGFDQNGEGADRVGEEHDAVARDVEVCWGVVRGGDGDVGAFEAGVGLGFAAVSGDLDQIWREIDAGYHRVRDGLRGGERGCAGAAAYVDDLAGSGGCGGEDRCVQIRGQVGEAAVGSAPFFGPDVADSAGPVIGCGHGWGASWSGRGAAVWSEI